MQTVKLMHISSQISSLHWCPMWELYFNNPLFMKCLHKPCCKSPSLLFPVNLEMSFSVGCYESYGVLWRRRPEVDRHLFRARSLTTELHQMGKWTDWNANFHTMINLRYEIVGTELSPRGCALLLYSISQLLPAITVNPHCPHTQSPFYITFIRRCTNVENIWRQPSELCFLWGWGASGRGRGAPAGPGCICSLGWPAVTPWGPLTISSIKALTHPPIDPTF